MIHEGEQFTRHLDLSAEVVVVGSGAGGPVAAKELQELGHSVIMIEEGGYYRTKDFVNDPIATFRTLYRDNGLTTALGRPPIPFPLGRCLGGTTTVNSGTCFRTPDKILDQWQEQWGLPDIGPEFMRPYFEKIESFYSIREVHSGNMGRNGELFLEGARALGYSGGPLKRNMDENCVGCGVCSLGCPTEGKKPTLVNYIPRASELGAEIYCDFRAEKILTQNGAAVGIEGSILNRKTRRRKTTFTIRAKLVVLAAGAVHTPFLLMKNKLGNSSGQVGRNLRLHPGIRVCALMDEEVRGWLGVPQGVFVDQFWDEGIMLEGIFVGPPLTAPSLPYIGLKNKELMFNYDKLAAFSAMIQDKTAGRVRTGPFGRPLITYNMQKDDLKKAVLAIAHTAEIFFAAGAKRVFPSISWLPEIRDRKETDRIINGPVKAADIEMMAFHPMGTCRMGTSPEHSVVDPYGESFDLKNLFVADASLFPSCLGVNPMQSIMAFAHRNADYIHNKKL